MKNVNHQTVNRASRVRAKGRRNTARALLLGVLGLAGASLPGAPLYAAAPDYREPVQRAEVLSATPIVEHVEVAVPREVCRDERVRRRYPVDYRSHRRSATPGIVGAIVGGAIGHSVGNGKKNKKIGTAVGAILGGSIGADISRRNHERRWETAQPVRYRTERVCRVETDYRTEEHISGYDVTYTYAGATYSTVLDSDPGRHLDVWVQVTPAE